MFLIKKNYRNYEENYTYCYINVLSERCLAFNNIYCRSCINVDCFSWV